MKANQTFFTWTGLEASEVTGRRTFPQLLSIGSRVFYETHLRPLLHMSGQIREAALELHRDQGDPMSVLVSAVMDRSPGDRNATVRVVIFDATERRKYEQELLTQKKRAEESEDRYARLARTLQKSLMPPANPRIPDMEVATAYRPAGTGDEIGGDFYDVFEVADGDWVVVIGDVSGKGAEAAELAVLARHTIRAVAVAQVTPSEILQQLNQVLLRHPNPRYLTAALLRIRRIDNWWSASIALGGHPPAIISSDRTRPRTIGTPGHPLGLFERGNFHDLRFELRPGGTLLLYTDGVTEARAPGQLEFYGESRLMQLLHDNTETAQGLVGRLLQDVLTFQHHTARDDIALVALQVPSAP